MALAALDHVTLRTARLGELTTFYARALGLRPGKRPPFDFDGAWLYCDSHAALHLVEVADSPVVPSPRIEHFAFRAENLAEFLAHLRELDVAYRTAILPEFEIRQVHIRDPDGNHVEIAFAREEEAELGDYPAG
jgi:catechol 2,3-dioxygenase-like lactoylglutathione lyase family enzyme